MRERKKNWIEVFWWELVMNKKYLCFIFGICIAKNLLSIEQVTNMFGSYKIANNMYVDGSKGVVANTITSKDFAQDLELIIKNNNLKIISLTPLNKKDTLMTVNKDGVTITGAVNFVSDVVLSNSTTLGGDVTIGSDSAGSLTVSSSALFKDSLTVSGSATLNSLLVSNTLTQGANNRVRIMGNGIIHSIGTDTNNPTTLFTVNYTTTVGSALLNLYVLGTSGGIEVQYYGTHVLTTGQGASSSISETTIESTGGSFEMNASFAAGSSFNRVSLVSKGESVSECSVFYEILGTRISSIQFGS